MSTRCQLRFTQKDSDRVAQIYRHSDGYPESVLPLLEHLQELLHESGALRGASYAVLQVALIDKLRYINHTIESENDIYSDWPETVAGILDPGTWKDIDTTPSYLLGHSIENPTCGIHGDEEYLYLIELPTRSPLEEPAEWTIKISEHCGFPRWDGPTEEAFEAADWQYEGTLADAIAELEVKR